MLLKDIDFRKVLFFDIETVTRWPTYAAMPDEWKMLWAERTQQRRSADNMSPEDFFNSQGAIYAEFSQVVCIGLGYLGADDTFNVACYYSDQEISLLEKLAAVLNQFAEKKAGFLCGHNIIEFDVPFLCRRYLLQGMPLPKLLEKATFRPWDQPYIDTMKLWQLGDSRTHVSLHFLTQLFGIPSPKNGEMNGKLVNTNYWQARDWHHIQTYCQKDVVAVGQLLLRYAGRPPAEKMVSKEEPLFLLDTSSEAAVYSDAG